MVGKSKKNITAIPQPQVASTPAAIPAWALPVLLLCTALLYSHALQNQLTSFDDDFYIVNNPFLKDYSWHGIKAIFTSFYTSNYHPLTTLTFFFEYHFFGLDPFPYHLLNVAFHVANTWLVYKVAEQLSGKKMTALITAALFAVHPMHVESVAWVSERKDVLYAFFYLLSLFFYLRYLSRGTRAKEYALVLLFFIASLLSKSAAVSLPVLFIAVDVYTGRKVTIPSLAEKIPFFLLSALFGVLNIMAQAEGGSINNIATSFGFINRVFLFTSAIASYLLRLVVPYKLSGMHYFPVLQNGFFPWEYYASLPLVAVVVWLIARRSPLRREVVFGSSFFLITVFLMLQLVSVGSALTAERYTYIAYIGLFYIVGQWVSGMATGQRRSIVFGVLAVFVLAYSVQTWARIGIWNDDVMLFNDMIEKNPNVFLGYWMRGNFEKRDGDLKAALQDYNISIGLNNNYDDSYYNRGSVLNALGQPKAAILDYTAAIKINPKKADVYNNRGWAYFTVGDTANAIPDLTKAIAIKPDYAEAYNNRGWVYYRSGNMAAALLDFDKALSIDPDYARARNNRAALKGNMGDLKGAVTDLTYLVVHDPANSANYFYRGIAELNMKDTAAACNDLHKAQGLGNEDAPKVIAQACH